MSRVFDWCERGQRLELLTEPGSGLIVRTTGNEIPRTHPLELPERAVDELREALVEVFGDRQRAELLETVHATEQQLGDLEGDLARERERADQLEAQLREQLAAAETAKSALDLADQRVRAAEADVAELRAELEGRYPTARRVRP